MKKEYKVLKPLQGYGYLIGDVTSHIRPEDAERFLKAKLIEEIPSKPAKKSNPKPTSKGKK